MAMLFLVFYNSNNLSRYGIDITISRTDIDDSIYRSHLYRFQFRYEKSLYRRLTKHPGPTHFHLDIRNLDNILS